MKLLNNKRQTKRINYKEAGITLIALVVTIIVLLILAGIAISLVLGENGLLVRAQSAHRVHTEAQIQEEIELAWDAIQVDGIPKGWSNETKSSALQTELRKQDDSATTEYTEPNITITYKGYETTINTEIGSMTALAKAEQQGGSVSTTYEVGQIVTLGTGANAEDFYVIKDNGDTVTLITKYNVETTNYTQSIEANGVAFDDNDTTDIYANASISESVSNYISAFQTKWGKTINQGRLLKIEEIEELGGVVSEDVYGYNITNCPTFINGNYWLSTRCVQYVEDGGIHSNYYVTSFYDNTYKVIARENWDVTEYEVASRVGLRIVITVLKSYL